jgi:hypothetical protein
MIVSDDDIPIWVITKGDLQNAAYRMFGRRITDDEIVESKKFIDAGLSFGLDTVFRASIEEAIDRCGS